ncbi:hypothetical protein [Spirochaeta cellobiosiphila]|uniref:hypothetical protein n=1 Tax=Spirochaeta cellobiosiphila TaxID=504483 RepID=UPI000423468A|nr:hypothetical protein [Spirochaeta cellobiosiphila]
MFSVDHIMIETRTPEIDANTMVKDLQLPYAWPLMVKNEYSSIGVNLGTFNIEFIDFKIRFGKPSTHSTGLSGIAFTSKNTIEEDYKYFEEKKIKYRVGENIEAHTTITLNEDLIFPTFFLVKYKFNTDGWKKRLNEEFVKANGGKYNISKVESIIINKKDVFNETFDNCSIQFNQNNSENEIVLRSLSIENKPKIIHFDNFEIKIV